MGLAPRSSVRKPRTSVPSGQRLAIQTAALRPTRTRWSMEGLVELLEVHAGVEGGDLIPVAVEHERVAALQLADATLRRLAPPGVAHFRVHVRVEAILAGSGFIPGRLRLVGREPDAHDGLAALE